MAKTKLETVPYEVPPLKPQPNPLLAASVLARAAQITQEDKKTTVKQVEGVPEDVAAAVDSFADAKSAKDKAVADYEAAKDVIALYGEGQRIATSRLQGAVQSSLVIKGANAVVQVTWSPQYSQVDLDTTEGVKHEEFVRQHLGAEFDRFLRLRTNVELTDDALNDVSFMEAFARFVEPYVERKYLRVKRKLAPTEEWNRQRVMDARVEQIHRAICSIVKPYEPRITVRR